MQRIFASKKKRQRTGLSFLLFAFTFLCVIGAAAFVILLGIRSGAIKSAAPQIRDFAFSIGALDPTTCMVDARNQLDCSADATGTPVRLVLGEMLQAREDLARERTLRIAAEERAKTATEALRRLAEVSRPERVPTPAAVTAEFAQQPYLMLPGDVVQPFSQRVTLVYRQPAGSGAVLIASDLWEGDREMEFYKVYRATLDEPGLTGEVEMVVTPTPAWQDGNRSIHLALKPQSVPSDD